MFEDVAGKPLKPGPRQPRVLGRTSTTSPDGPPAAPGTLALNGWSPPAADGGS